MKPSRMSIEELRAHVALMCFAGAQEQRLTSAIALRKHADSIIVGLAQCTATMDDRQD